MAAAAKKKATTTQLPGWDLSALYKSIKDPAIARDIAALEKKSTAFAKRYQGKLAKPGMLAESILDYEKLQDSIGKLGSYAQLVYSADMQTPAITQFYQNISETLTTIGSTIIFYTLEINKLSDKDMKAAEKNRTVAKFKPYFDTIRAYDCEPHCKVCTPADREWRDSHPGQVYRWADAEAAADA